MRVGMHEMHALRVRYFFHDKDRGGRQLPAPALQEKTKIYPQNCKHLWKKVPFPTVSFN